MILYHYPRQSVMTNSPRYTNRPSDGFLCVGHVYDNTNENICKQACFGSATCGAMSFNPVSGICQLATQPCVLVEKHDEYRLMVFRPEEQVQCAVWVGAQAGITPSRAVTAGSSTYVARVAIGGDVLVGYGLKIGDNFLTFIAHEGQMSNYPSQDLLTVHPNCSMAWVPYTAGDVLPRNALVTGMLANGRRLYSSQSWHVSVWVAGVYAEEDTAAYYASGGSNAVTQFNILVSV